MKSRRYFLKQGALASAAFLMPKPFMSFAGQVPASPFKPGDINSITLLHTNDLHNQLEPVTHDMYTGMGGFEKTAAVISGIKNENSNVLLLDAGDIFNGNMHHQNKHETILQMMRSAGYDAALLGNRDYEAGSDYLQEQWRKNNVPLVASNYYFKESSLKSLHQPYKIVEKGNIKIGIIGAGINLKGLVRAEVNGLVEYTDPLEQLSAIAAMLKQEKKCNLVICLSHLGYKNKMTIDDIALATRSKNIDVIIGGHSHTFMQAPQVVLNQQQQEVIINHAGYGGIVLGNMNISFDEDGNKNGVTFNNLAVGAEENAWFKKQCAGITVN